MKPPSRGDIAPGHHGLDIRWDGQRAVVVSARGPVAGVGLRAGTELLAVDGRAVADIVRERLAEVRLEGARPLVAREAVRAALQGPPGAVRCLSWLDEEARVDRAIHLSSPGRDGTVRLGWFPPASLGFAVRTPAEGVAHVRFELFAPPLQVQFADAVRHARRGLIIDLRGNLGGIGAMVMGLGGHLFEPRKGLHLGELRFRTHTLRLVVSPKPAQLRFRGPVAVLVDETSASTAEIFAAGLHVLGRARLFGRRSSGLALPSQVEAMPNGDLLQYVVADFVDPSGRRLEGRGVQPDVWVALDRVALRAGRDPAVEAAVQWILQS